MPPQKQKGEIIRWSINAACVEFGFDRKTLTKRLAQAGIESEEGTGGTYTTRQICSAAFGDSQAARTRLANEQADKIAIENEVSRRELIPVKDAVEVAQRFCAAIRQRILSSAIPEAEKNIILKEIQRLADADLSETPTDDEEAA